MTRAAFEEGVVEALRTWRTPREFATNVLLHSRLVPQGSTDPVTALRGAFTAALDALQVDPAGVKAHDVLTATYISASRTHKATARRLGVPYGTYRRHLALAKELLIEQLLLRVRRSGERPVGHLAYEVGGKVVRVGALAEPGVEPQLLRELGGQAGATADQDDPVP